VSNRAVANLLVVVGLVAIAGAAFVLHVSAGLSVVGIEFITVGLGVLRNDRRSNQ
jgi:hypothetical protein